MTYQGLAAHQGNLQRLMFAYQADHALYELVSAEIGDLGQGYVTT